MGKLDELRRATGSNVAESMGKGVAKTTMTHRASSSTKDDRWVGIERLAGAQRIHLDRIVRDPSQPREFFAEAELNELAESIRARGMLQPIRVRWEEEQGVYMLIAGERRFRAASIAGLVDAPCVIHDGPLNESEILLDQLAENLVRLDLEPIEQAKAFKRLIDANGWSARRLANALSIDHDKVNRAVRLLELPEMVQAAVAEGSIAPTTAFELSKLDDNRQSEVAARVVAEKLTRADVAEVVRAVTKSPKGTRIKGSKPPKPRTFRTTEGKVTVEAKRHGLEAMLAAIRQTTAQIEALLATMEQEAA